MSCPICIESPVDVHTSCGHAFCKPCIDRWVKTCRKKPTCPLCRASLPKPKRAKIQSDQEQQSNGQELIIMANYIIMAVVFIMSIYLLKMIAIIVNGLIILLPKLFVFYLIIYYIFCNWRSFSHY